MLNSDFYRRNLKGIIADQERWKRNITSARFDVLSSTDAAEGLPWIPSLDLGVGGESESSCWPRKTIVPLVEASSKEACSLLDYTAHWNLIKSTDETQKAKGKRL